MRWKALSSAIIFAALTQFAPRAAAFDWDPVTDAEKTMKTSPLDPGAGAVVLFKRGQLDVLEKSSLFWTTRMQTYVRIKVFTDAGREAGNVSVEAPKYIRVSKIEGRTILPSGEIIPLDSSKVFRGKAYQEGKQFAVMATRFTFPSVEPGAIIEYQVEENVDWFYPPPWIFDTREVGTLQSSLRVVVGPRLDMALYPLDTTVSKIAVTQNQTVQGSQFDFSVKNLRPIQSEPFSPPYRDLATMVIFTPRQLGFSGQVYPIITKWDDVGQEIKRELDKMEQSSKEAKNKARELAEKLPDQQKKAEAIYSYIQQNVTSSDLGGVNLGRTADEILSAKRGDPDEINALFILMLREVKIDADMVLLATRNWQILVGNFPNFSQFSRIITRVNFREAPVFVDPADAASPFGELPWFDRGVQGLAVKGNKVQPATIPDGTVDENLSTMKVAMQIAKDWSVEGDEEVALKGTEAIDLRADLLEDAPEKQEQTLTDFFAFGHSDAEVSKIEHPQFRDTAQPLVLKAHFREKLTNEAGPGELLLNPWMNDRYERPLFKTTVRRSEVRFTHLEKRVSACSWQLAPEIKVEQLPKEMKIEDDMGSFSHSCAQAGATITCTRTYVLKKQRLQTNTEYLNAKKFFDEIAKQDQEVIVLREQ